VHHRVIDTSGKWKKSSVRNVFIISFVHLWVTELAYRYIFSFKFTLSCQQSDIVPIVPNLPPVSLIPLANLPPVSLTLLTNLPPVSTTPGELAAKFATGVVDTSGKFAAGVVDTGTNFAAGVVDTGGAPRLVNISANFRKNSK
jgi:hypothetical protein